VRARGRPETRPCRGLLLALILLTSAPLPVAADGLRAGFGVEPLPAPIGGPLAGYGGLRDRLATGVLDPPEARALVLEYGELRVAIVSLDLLIVRPRVRAVVLEELGEIELDTLLLAATHTHSGPGGFEPGWVAGRVTGSSWNGRAPARLARAAARAVQRAWASRGPAKIATGMARTRVPENRSWSDGRRDTALPLLRVELADGGDPVILFALAAHPIVLSNRSHDYSADYVGAARQRLEALGWRPLFLAGALGDQRPVSTLGELWPEMLEAQREQAREIGERLAGEVLVGVEQLAPPHSASLAATVRWVEKPESQLRRYCPFWWLSPFVQSTLRSFFSQRLPFAAVRVGDALFYGLPAEPTSALGASLRARTDNASVPFVVAHANDWMGYAVAPDEYERGGYEACMSFFGPGIGPWLVDEAQATAAQLEPRSARVER
jgi:hypothetical protein